MVGAISSPLVIGHKTSGAAETETEVLARGIVSFIKKNKIKLTHRDKGPELTDAEIKNLVDALVIKVATIKGGFYEGQIQSGIRNANEKIGDLLLSLKNGTTTVESFLETIGPTLTVDRNDDDIFGVFSKNILRHKKQREELANELGERTAELKIFGIIQSQVSEKLGNKATLSIGHPGINLLDEKLYGYTDSNELQNKAEGKLLKKLFGEDVFTKPHISKESNRKEVSTPAYVSIRMFLEKPNKESGSFPNLGYSYKSDVEPNPLANFSTMLNDRSRSVTNKVSELTTKLQDVTTRYSSAVEALSRFVRDFDNIIKEIMGKI